MTVTVKLLVTLAAPSETTVVRCRCPDLHFLRRQSDDPILHQSRCVAGRTEQIGRSTHCPADHHPSPYWSPSQGQLGNRPIRLRWQHRRLIHFGHDQPQKLLVALAVPSLTMVKVFVQSRTISFARHPGNHAGVGVDARTGGPVRLYVKVLVGTSVSVAALVTVNKVSSAIVWLVGVAKSWAGIHLVHNHGAGNYGRASLANHCR